MPRPKKQPINDTLNIILVKVLSGVNYASKLATETGKSIPVVFRQLDELISSGLLKKERQGKRVEYEVKWDSVGTKLSNIVTKDIQTGEKLGIKPDNNQNSSILKKSDIEPTIKDIMMLKPIQNAFKSLFKGLEYKSQILSEKVSVDFKESLNYFLEGFSMLNPKEKAQLLSQFTQEQRIKVRDFLLLSEFHSKIRRSLDPRQFMNKK
tara:strand:+ start:1016 stop:1639 length:624 start_codon:yes stop_codon:yes gene_type:complete